jgi:Uma2 family endonuclease
MRTRPLRRIEYERLVDLGMFAGERLELIDGVLVLREPQKAPHSTSVRAVQDTLRRVFGTGWDVRPQLPVALDNVSEPEPDMTVVPGSYRDYRRGHPAKPALVVEIADATLMRDRRKGGLYARAGVPDYWLVNLIDDVLEVYRQPHRSPGSRFGWVYAEMHVFPRGDVATPLAAPDARVSVDDLLP